jgi:hypothetical protein
MAVRTDRANRLGPSRPSEVDVLTVLTRARSGEQQSLNAGGDPCFAHRVDARPAQMPMWLGGRLLQFCVVSSHVAYDVGLEMAHGVGQGCA